MAALPWVSGAVEGITDEAMLRRLCLQVGTQASVVYGRGGKQNLLQLLAGYNHSARFRHWFVLIDLDREPCAPGASTEWLPDPAPLMCFRIAVRELESWILADAERLAMFLRVEERSIPANPDGLADPKQVLVNVARLSRSRDIREDIVPRPGSGQSVGPAYASRLIEFLQPTPIGWRPEVAVNHSTSLRRCIQALEQLVLRPFPAARTP